VKDIEKAVTYPEATKDSAGACASRPRPRWATRGSERTEQLIDAECNVVLIDTAHGHNKDVAAGLQRVKKLSQFGAGGWRATRHKPRRRGRWIDAGADGVKVGSGRARSAPRGSSPGVGVRKLTRDHGSRRKSPTRPGYPIIGDGPEDVAAMPQGVAAGPRW